MIRFKNILGATLLMAMAATNVYAQKIVSKAAHSDMHKQLLANQAKTKFVSLKKTHSLTSSTT